MTRRLLETARGVVVHSRFMEGGNPRRRVHRAHGGDPARRLDSRGRPQRLARTSWGWTKSRR